MPLVTSDFFIVFLAKGSFTSWVFAFGTDSFFYSFGIKGFFVLVEFYPTRFTKVEISRFFALLAKLMNFLFLVSFFVAFFVKVFVVVAEGRNRRGITPGAES